MGLPSEFRESCSRDRPSDPAVPTEEGCHQSREWGWSPLSFLFRFGRGSPVDVGSSRAGVTRVGLDTESSPTALEGKTWLGYLGSLET